MGLPDEICISITTEGMVFELRVAALPQGCAFQFPGQGCADEFHKSGDLQSAVARAAACALDAAVFQFRKDFYLALSSALDDILKKEAA